MQEVQDFILGAVIIITAIIIGIIPVNILETQYPDISGEGILIVFCVFFVLSWIVLHGIIQRMKGA
jgi:hypothetical protein